MSSNDVSLVLRPVIISLVRYFWKVAITIRPTKVVAVAFIPLLIETIAVLNTALTEVRPFALAKVVLEAR